MDIDTKAGFAPIQLTIAVGTVLAEFNRDASVPSVRVIWSPELGIELAGRLTKEENDEKRDGRNEYSNKS